MLNYSLRIKINDKIKMKSWEYVTLSLALIMCPLKNYSYEQGWLRSFCGKMPIVFCALIFSWKIYPNTSDFFVLLLNWLIYKSRECPHGVMVKALNCGVIVSEFKLQLCYYIYFWSNTLGKGMWTPLSPQLWVK